MGLGAAGIGLFFGYLQMGANSSIAQAPDTPSHISISGSKGANDTGSKPYAQRTTVITDEQVSDEVLRRVIAFEEAYLPIEAKRAVGYSALNRANENTCFADDVLSVLYEINQYHAVDFPGFDEAFHPQLFRTDRQAFIATVRNEMARGADPVVDYFTDHGGAQYAINVSLESGIALADVKAGRSEFPGTKLTLSYENVYGTAYLLGSGLPGCGIDRLAVLNPKDSSLDVLLFDNMNIYGH